MATNEGSTVIGESIVVNANLSGDEDLTVRGRIEGTINITKALLIDQTGVVKAEVQARTAVISGAVVGNVVATESVEITKEGRMVGDISAPRVIIVDGASFRGRIDMGEVDVDATERPALSRTSSRPALRQPSRAGAPGRAPERELPEHDEDEDEADEGEDERMERPERERTGGFAKPPSPPIPVAMGAVKRKVIVRRK